MLLNIFVLSRQQLRSGDECLMGQCAVVVYLPLSFAEGSGFRAEEKCVPAAP